MRFKKDDRTIFGIRKVSMEDASDIYEWEFDPSTRKWMQNQEKVEMSEHLSWLASVIANKDIHLLICLKNQKFKVAVIRIDRNLNNKSVEIGITVNPDFRGQGIGKYCLTEAMYFVQKHIWKTNEFIANIKKGNLASINLFSSVGFVKYSETSDTITLNKIIHESQKQY